MKNQLEDFVNTSNRIGVSVAFIQGGGGNTSLKISETDMIIKASGQNLKDMTSEKGYTNVNYTSVLNYLESPDDDEHTFIKTIKSFSNNSDCRPSVETGFHALLGKAVIHTHSTYANFLTCSANANNLIQKLFPNAVWVDYCSPGRDLTLTVKEAVKNVNINKNLVVFLQNHGLIVSSGTPNEAEKLHTIINEKIIDSFKLPKFNFDLNLFDSTNKVSDKTKILFPDQIVYSLASAEALNTQAAKETIASYKYILDNIQINGQTPRFLTETEVKQITDMESEAYRLKVLMNDNSPT